MKREEWKREEDSQFLEKNVGRPQQGRTFKGHSKFQEPISSLEEGKHLVT